MGMAVTPIGRAIVSTFNAFDRFRAEVLPGDLDESCLSRFRSLARVIKVRKGETPLAGHSDDQVVFIASGSTKLVAHASKGREQIVGFQFANDLVSVPADSAHAYTLSALQDCEIAQFNAAPFFELAGQQTGLVIAIMERALDSLAHCREKSITLGRGSAQEKIAGFLLAMAKRIGAPEGKGHRVILPMSRRDIADSLGLSVETVSRQITQLRLASLLDTDGRAIYHLSDIAALRARAGNLPANT